MASKDSAAASILRPSSAREARHRAESILAGDRAFNRETLAGDVAKDLIAALDAVDEALERLNDGDVMGAKMTLGWPS